MVLPCMLHLSTTYLPLHPLQYLISDYLAIFIMPEAALEPPSSPKSRYSKHIIVGTLGSE